MLSVRVLHVVASMEMGGIESFIMNVYRHVDREKVQFDFLYHYEHPAFFDEEIQNLGGRIYRTSVREDNRFFDYFRELNAVFAENEYVVLHGHYSGFGVFYNHFAKKNGVSTRVGHVHSDRFSGVADRILSSLFRYNLTHRIACTQRAGDIYFGRYPFEVMPNAVDIQHFQYKEKRRTDMRDSLGLSEFIVIGHVGRFDSVKNHDFLIKSFFELVAHQANYRLLLVGTGVLQEQIEKRVVDLGIVDKVVFAGRQSDTAAFYDAMDIFSLPSLYEGLPLCLVEAQASGLPCVVSSRVNTESVVSDALFLDIEQPSEWANAFLHVDVTRRDNIEKLRAAHFDIRETAKKLQIFYLEQTNSGLEK